MKKVLSLFQVIVITISIIFTFVGISISQMEDPNRDVIPESFLKNLPPRIIPTMAVVTIDDYDNFNMGTDQSEGHVSMNPMNPLQVFCAFNINGPHYTNDGGLTWLQFIPAFPSTAGDPITAYDSLGNLFYETLNSGITACWVAKSTTNGASWLWANVSAATGNDKNWIACDQTGGPYSNYIYTIMTNSTAGGAQVARSTNGGTSFTNTAVLTPHSLPGSMVCVGPNGNTQGGCVYAITHSGTNAAGVYSFFVSTDAGLTFTAKGSNSWSNVIGTEISSRSTVSGMRCRPYPMIAADNSYGPYRGRVYCVYASNEPAGSGNKSDIFLRYSTDQGTTWSARVTVNDDANTQNNFQFHPAIWCDKTTGKLYIKFYDTRNCPTSDSTDVYATYTTDGGATFAPNQKITNKMFKIKLSASGNPPAYQGDYDAINSNSRDAMLVWGDFRNNSYGSYSAYFPDFGMRLNPLQDSINSTNGIVYISGMIPSVKLFTDTVWFSSSITPAPASGTFSITYPSGNWVNTFPGSKNIKVTANNVTPGVYTLNVKGLGTNGTPVHLRTMTIIAGTTVTGISGNENPNMFKLEQNYPNPFNPVTKIGYSIAKQSNVKITIFDVLGKEITSFKNENQAPGNYNVIFNASYLSTGVYYYKIEAGEFTEVKKMTLIK